MKYFLMLIVLIFSTVVYAADQTKIAVNIGLKINGKKTAVSKIITLSGEETMISVSPNESSKTFTFVRLTPTIFAKNNVSIAVTVGKIFNGKEKIFNKSKLLTTIGKKVVVYFGSSKNHSQNSISLTATKDGSVSQVLRTAGSRSDDVS